MSAKQLQKFLKRKQAYTAVFPLDNQAVIDVLEDLAKFCRANQTTFHPDARLHAVLTGRHEVWLRIQQHIRLPEAELWARLGGTQSLETLLEQESHARSRDTTE